MMIHKNQLFLPLIPRNWSKILLYFPCLFGLSFSIGVRLLVCRPNFLKMHRMSRPLSRCEASFFVEVISLWHHFRTAKSIASNAASFYVYVVVLCELRPPNICTPYYMTFSTFPDAKTTFFVTNICLLWLSFLAVLMICNTNYFGIFHRFLYY